MKLGRTRFNQKRSCVQSEWEEVGYLGSCGNGDSQLASRTIVFKGFTDDALTFPAGSTNSESALATVGITSLFVGLIDVAINEDG